MDLTAVAYASCGAVSLASSLVTVGYGYWQYERKVQAIRRAEPLHDLQTLVQRVGTHRDLAQSLVGPRIFCKMAGTVGCKAPMRSGLTHVSAAISEVTYNQRLNLFQRVPKTQRIKIPFTCDLPGGGSVMVNDEGAEIQLEVTLRRRDLREKILRCGGPVFVIGSVGLSKSGSYELSKGMFRWFMISYLSEEEILQRYGLWWNVHCGAGVGLLVVGVFCLAKAFNEI